MKEAQMHFINKMFNDKTIRTVWNKEEEKYYISVVDIAETLTDSVDLAGYWRKLKQRLKQEGNEPVTNCHGLKLKARDGKYRMTDVVDIEKNLGRSVVSKDNALSYKYIEDDLIIENNNK